MVFSTIIHRDLKVARRLASWLIVLSIFFAWSMAPAKADMIDSTESVSAEQTHFSMDYRLISTNWLFGGSLSESVGSGAPATRDETPSRLALPESSSEPSPPETEFIGLGIPGPSSGTTGAGSGSSSSSRSSAGHAILCWISDLPQPTLVGWLYSAITLHIPLAPPFKLLRPPKILTILA